ncbi:hypothetical protein ABZ319_01735 [Nocardia sp. NPDC005978]|uniref:hypothetical protein n=1 Tax=Nocardia sp. NPDC005978 TaxID=3156725 RepID=UPI0033AD4A52
MREVPIVGEFVGGLIVGAAPLASSLLILYVVLRLWVNRVTMRLLGRGIVATGMYQLLHGVAVVPIALWLSLLPLALWWFYCGAVTFAVGVSIALILQLLVYPFARFLYNFLWDNPEALLNEASHPVDTSARSGRTRRAYDLDVTYALYAWGSFIDEVGLNRDPGWLDAALLRGERDVVSTDLMIGDTETLRVDGPGTIFDVDGRRLRGHDLVGRDLTAANWQVAHILVATDGTREHALTFMAEVEEDGEYEIDDEPQDNPVGVGEVVKLWSDQHGQWDLALVRM